MIIGRRVIRLPVTTSTMDEIDRLAKQGEAEGLVVVADRQTAGRGRAGRTWHTASGAGLLFSILLRPVKAPADVAAFPLVVGLAVADAIDEIAAVQSTLKWPNDVLINNRKVAGILMTTRITGERLEYLNVGIGINVEGKAGELPLLAASIAAESQRVVDRESLLQNILAKLDDFYAAYCIKGSSRFVLDWNMKAAFVNERVSVETGVAVIEGILRGADDQGALVIEREDGTNERVTVGELTRGPLRAVALNGNPAN
jgi:BirA family biotin operon repressor/biotin-[acetyl-CoA-carboxylase] ligase